MCTVKLFAPSVGLVSPARTRTLPAPRRYVRLQQNGSGVVGIDSFTSLGTTTYYNDMNQLITSWFMSL